MNPLTLPVDPFGITNSFLTINSSWMLNGLEFTSTLSKLASDLQSAGTEGFTPFWTDGASKGPPDDPEAAILAMVRNYSQLLQKIHSAYGNWLKDYVDKAQDVPNEEKQCSKFWVNQILNSISPSNFFWTNPSVMQKFLRSKGKSAIKGYENWLEDVQCGDSLVRIADTKAFKVGENLATTPGFVVFRNRLMELIQYSPRTETTHRIPIVFIQPWINKFYIFDLGEDKSFVSYLVNQGFTVFITSWKNPSSEMRNVTFENYMIRGALKAVEVAREICNVEQVHAAGYCIGGTVLSALMAWLNRAPDRTSPIPIRDFTLFASLVDYSSPGELGVYISENSIRMIEQLMQKDGYLDEKYMTAAFRLLRSNDLIWRYYIHNYLQGELPPKSDFLYWNSDSTRLTQAMCSFYLREFYLKNKLVEEDGTELAGRPIDLRRIEQPLYVVGAEQDHICPWQETFKISNLVKGPVRFTLSAEGHITGIVNPPSTRARKKYWTNDITEPVEADEWHLNQQQDSGSWWLDWVRWLTQGSDPMCAPPPMGSKKYRPLEKAPGSYVMGP